jgi:hypothetical protein
MNQAEEPPEHGTRVIYPNVLRGDRIEPQTVTIPSKPTTTRRPADFTKEMNDSTEFRQ